MNQSDPKVTESVEMWRHYDQPGDRFTVREPLRPQQSSNERPRSVEALMTGERIDFQALSPAQITEVVDELRVRQIGLATENEKMRRAQEEVTAARDRYADLYDYAPIAYITTDADGTIVAANLVAADLLCVRRDEMIGSPLSDFVARHDQNTLDFHRREVRRYGCLKNCALTMVKANGETFPAQLDSVVSPDREGSFDHCRTVITDVTERVRTEQALALLRHRESLEVLAAGLAHDFNNLLTAVMAAHSLATLDLKSPEHLPAHLHVMGEGLAAIRDLVLQLLTLSSSTPSDKSAVAAKKLVETGCRRAVVPDNVECECGLVERLWPVLANEATMSRAIQNLVTNAGEAMAKGGLIRITAGNEVVLRGQIPELRAGRYVRISIADAGPGIPEEHLPRIFDPYFSTKPRATQCGMGLGLATCRAIVKEHGGAITVETRLGAGTTFDVYLPAATATARPAPAKPPGDGQLLTGVGRILVMDDQEMVRTAADNLLAQLGYTPVTACDGAEAVRLYRRALESGERFAAVILDLTVPRGMAGTVAVKELLKIDPTVVALISTGFANDPVVNDFWHYGFRGALPKPYNLAELGEALHTALHGE
jgi:two-component system cell cycle sensor histidine kinase/response regulator CckA